jgi:hypothetical protein
MANYCRPTSDGAVFPPRVGAIVLSHLSHVRRSNPGGKRSRIARRRVISAARLIARSSIAQAWSS